MFYIFHIINAFHHEQDSLTNMSTLKPELGRNVNCWFLRDCMSQFQHSTDPLHILPPQFPSNHFVFLFFSKYLWHLKSVSHCFKVFSLFLYHIPRCITIISDFIHHQEKEHLINLKVLNGTL